MGMGRSAWKSTTFGRPDEFSTTVGAVVWRSLLFEGLAGIHLQYTGYFPHGSIAGRRVGQSCDFIVLVSKTATFRPRWGSGDPIYAEEAGDEGPDCPPHRDEALRSLLASVEEWVVPDVAVGA